MKTCKVEGCVSTKGRFKTGMCQLHYNRTMRLGSPHLPTKPTAEEMFWEKVDKSDGCWEWTGAKTPLGYPRFRGNEYGHRFSWALVNGPIPEKGEIDHRCHNPGCVRPDHLRLATRKQNIENHSGPKKNSKSGVRGVHERPSGTWFGRVRHDGTIYYLGTFKDIRDAEAAVVAKRNELHAFNDLDRAVRKP